MTRTVTLVLVNSAGELLGETEPFEAGVPWWQEVADFGPGLQVLRLLHADRPAPPGGHVVYLAEVTDEAANIRKIRRQAGSDWLGAVAGARPGTGTQPRAGVGVESGAGAGAAVGVGAETGAGAGAAVGVGVETGGGAGAAAGVGVEAGAGAEAAARVGAGAEAAARAGGRSGEGVGVGAEAGGGATSGASGIGRDGRGRARRAAYAEVGGPSAAVAWALGIVGRASARQCRTWNLSAIWRLDDADGVPVAWLKQVPEFFAHEAYALRMVGRVAPGLVPELIAEGEHGRMLLQHAPGEDRYGAGAELCAEIARAFHPIQAHFAADPEPLLKIPDGRLQRTLPDYVRVAEPHYDVIPGLRELIEDLPRRFAAIAGCGLPDTLVHGDLHPGNVRTDDRGKLTIMDWGDCSFGNPALDILRLTDGATGGGDESGAGVPGRDRLQAEWAERWQQTVPGSDPLRAVELMQPVAALRGALVYATFLQNIEPTEWPYHAADVPERLTAAVALAGK